MADDLQEMGDDVLELTLEETSWAPPPVVGRHAGVAVEPDQDFFADPPPEIGEVLSAESSLRVGKKPWKTSSRIVIAGLAGWAGSMILHTFEPNVVLEAILFASLSLVAWFLTRFSGSCSFVGGTGACRFTCKGNRNRVSRKDLFLFEEAAELRTSQTRHYHNGIYTGTQYKFSWTDETGRVIFKLSGTYRGEKAPPKPKDPFHFAVSTEAAWTVHILGRLSQEKEETGLARFRLSGNNWVAVGDGHLQISRKGIVERLEFAEIGDVSIDSGVVKIKRVDAKEGWFSSTGVHKFPYDSMANFQAFAQAYLRWVVGNRSAQPSAFPVE